MNFFPGFRVIAVGALAIASALPVYPVYADGFSFDTVIQKAQALAKKPYKAPAAVPDFLQKLSEDEYQQIQFKPAQARWHSSKSLFQVGFVPAGRIYDHTVKVNEIDDKGVQAVAFDKADFSYPTQKLEKIVPADLGYAGFFLTYPMGGKKDRQKFMVFAGASYFRGIGADNKMGLFSRGVLVDTGLPSGEEFPSFTEYWLERPKPNAHEMQFYALLNGDSLTGAYRFTVIPGSPTKLKVNAVLFTRNDIKLLGIAPLTSMFFYGENTPRPPGYWNPQKHDSDGLLLHSDDDEWLWRPLRNPKNLEMDYFSNQDTKGFGLLQRQTNFYAYEDPDKLYGQRPSAWVQPDGDWGKGKVVLVQIPTNSADNGNIVAAWQSAKPVKANQKLTYSYTLKLGDSNVAGEPMAKTDHTYVGKDGKGIYHFVVDFSGGDLDKVSPQAAVVGELTGENGTKVTEHFVQYLEPVHKWRLSIDAKPAGDKLLELRAFLKKGKQTLSETWTYNLPADNRIGSGQ